MEGKKVEIHTPEDQEEGSVASEDVTKRPVSEEETASEEEGRARVTDRRRIHADAAEEPAGAEEKEEVPSLVPTYVEELQRKVSAAEEKLREHIERLNKESAEFRARQERELERRTQEMRKHLVSGFLGIADDLARATAAAEEATTDPAQRLESLVQGVRMIQGRFFQELASQGVQPMQAKGQLFNPERHEALRMVEVDDPALDGTVVEELATGYLLGEEVLRPSRVSVGKLRPSGGEGTSGESA